MLDELKQMYGEHLHIDSTLEHPENYYWFETSDGTPFAIRKQVVTENERKLLSLSFKPYTALDQSYTQEEKYWSRLLFTDESISDISQGIGYPVQFIHFYSKKPVLETENVNEIFLSFFPDSSLILWSTDQNGTLILKNSPDEELSYDDIIETLASELFIDMSIFFGTTILISSQAKKIYDVQEKMFELFRRCYPKHRFFTYKHGLPLLLIHQNRETLGFSEINPLNDEEDLELLSSIEIFLESNMNLSIAAKRLYIHRNSLQYRIDKFYEKTGLNPKDFQDAITIYLLLIENRMKTL